MFSKEYMQEIRRGFDRKMALIHEMIDGFEKTAVGTGGEGLPESVLSGGLAALRLPMLQEKKQEMEEAFSGCTADEGEALAFLYSAMPLSDILDYPAKLFLSYARHGAFLWKEGPFAGRVPEGLFANYVLHHRVNNEDLVDLRPFFYEKVIGLADPENMEKTVIEANYWCAGEGTYRSTDGRTQNARTMYHTATGRCGEESTFAVSVLRSLGIPARQVYAPLWSHCDDNHAWVEAWCDGKWYFFGACEPEERLNYGWFIEPASRAMLLHSRWFGPDEPLDPVLGKKGVSRVLNHMERYAHTIPLTIRIVDENGEPVPGARVECQVVNAGELRPIASLTSAGAESAEPGTVRMLTGLGDLYVAASGAGCYGEAKVSLTGSVPGQKGEAVVVLRPRPECTGDFRDLEFQAPKAGKINDDTLTDKQKAVGQARNQEAELHRTRKKAGFYQSQKAETLLVRFPEADRGELDEILHKSLGNMGEIVKFLEWESDCLAPQEQYDRDRDPAENARWAMAGPDGPAGRKPGCWKLEVLRALREKDLWDIQAEILMECCENASPRAGLIPGGVFYPFLVNPRVANEMVRPGRHFLAGHVSPEQREAIDRDPGILPALVDQWIRSIPDQEYEDLITSPVACLRGGVASPMSKKVFCVNLYRALGIPARIRMKDGGVEYYRNGDFVPACGKEPESAGLTIRGSASLSLTDWALYSLDRFEKDRYVPVRMWDHYEELQKNQVCLRLVPGIYRALTTNRRADGSQLVKYRTFELKEGESRDLELSLRPISAAALRREYEVRDLGLLTPEGAEVRLKNLSGRGRALLVWLEVTREPTEHILNELYEKSADFTSLEAPLYVVVKKPEDLEDPTLKRTMAVIPALKPLFHDFGEEYKVLAEKIGLEAGRLPLAMVLEDGAKSVYADAGYNVGLADRLYRVLKAEEREG